MSIISTDFGIQIDCREQHPQKTSEESVRSFESDSKMTADRDVHPLKQSLPIISTDFGIQIDCREEQCRNEPGSIVVNSEAGSNSTSLRFQ
jgi:hypothetical protein